MMQQNHQPYLNDPSPNWKKVQLNQTFLPAVTKQAATNGRDEETTRIVVMSDTHGQHRLVAVPDGDILIHAGDMTRSGEHSSLEDLNQYFHELAPRFSSILAIAGNHDITLHPEYYETNWQRYHRRKLDTIDGFTLFSGCQYLQDSETVLKQGKIRVYGSPWTPYYYGWAFNVERGLTILDKWKSIPEETDILITHGPPLGRQDNTDQNIRAGCEDLLFEVQNRIQPRLHIFGHIHEGYGCSFDGQTLYVNGSNVNHVYQPTKPCIVIDLPDDISQPAAIVRPVCRIDSLTAFQTWLARHDEVALAAMLDDVDQNEFEAVRHGLLSDTAFTDIVDLLRLHRDEATQKRLRTLLNLLYAESFS